jgi:DNA-binding response OmpR family regulator
MDVQVHKPASTQTGLAARISRSLRMLLVEDHIDTAMMMSRLLRGKGHKVDHAPDVATAMRLLAEREFDILLSDLGLPDGNGWHIMRGLRSNGSKMPGIAVSGYGQHADIQKSMDAGYHAHLTKPVDIGDLLTKVREIVQE